MTDRCLPGCTMRPMMSRHSSRMTAPPTDTIYGMEKMKPWGSGTFLFTSVCWLGAGATVEGAGNKLGVSIITYTDLSILWRRGHDTKRQNTNELDVSTLADMIYYYLKITFSLHQNIEKKTIKNIDKWTNKDTKKKRCCKIWHALLSRQKWK